MKKILSLLALVMLCVMGAKAETIKYALAEGDTFTSGQSVEVKNGSDVVATITYGESDGADFKAAKAATNIDGYTAFTEGNGTNGEKTGGTFYTITPKVDAKIAVAVVLNADKKFYILEDGTALTNYDGITVSAKFYGTYEFDAKAGKAYKFYCAGSKLGFFGFEMTIAGSVEPVEPTNKTITLVPGVWATDGATFAAYVWNADGNKWIPFVAAGENYATQISDAYTGLIVTRINPDGTDEDPWKNVWNQTSDIDFTTVADGSVITITGWEQANYTITNPLQEAREKLTKIITLAEMLDAEALAAEIAAAKEAVAGTDIEAMQTATNAFLVKALPIAQEVIALAKEFAQKYGYSEVTDAITALEGTILAAMGGNMEPLQAALDNLIAVALPAAKDAIGKIEGYSGSLENEALSTAIAAAKAALASNKVKDIITKIKALEEPFRTAAQYFIAKVTAENIEDPNVMAALAAVKAAAEADPFSIVAFGDAVKELIKAYKAYQLALDPVYTVAGTADLTGYEWDTTQNEMKKNEDTGLYEWTAKFITVTNDQQPKFKVVKNYTEWYPEGGEETNWVITPEVLEGEGIYSIITITFNAETKEITVSGIKRETPVYADDNVYFWESPDGYVNENGGVAVHNKGGRVNYAQAGYFTISLNGKADFSTDVVTITLNEGVTLSKGDQIAITAFRNKDAADKVSGALLKFDDGSTITTGNGMEFVNINAAVSGTSEYGTEPNTVIVNVPESAVGSKTIQMTRSKTGTNLFITKIEIAPNITTGISTVAANVVNNGQVYNLAGQKVQTMKKGLYIVNGKKVLMK